MQSCEFCCQEAIFSCSCTTPEKFYCLQHFSQHRYEKSGLHQSRRLVSSESILAFIQTALCKLTKEIFIEAKESISLIKYKVSQDLCLINTLKLLANSKLSENISFSFSSLESFEDKIKEVKPYFGLHFTSFIENVHRIQSEAVKNIKSQKQVFEEGKGRDEQIYRNSCPNINKEHHQSEYPPQYETYSSVSDPNKHTRTGSEDFNQRNSEINYRANAGKIKIPQIRRENFEEVPINNYNDKQIIERPIVRYYYYVSKGKEKIVPWFVVDQITVALSKGEKEVWIYDKEKERYTNFVDLFYWRYYWVNPDNSLQPNYDFIRVKDTQL